MQLNSAQLTDELSHLNALHDDSVLTSSASAAQQHEQVLFIVIPRVVLTLFIITVALFVVTSLVRRRVGSERKCVEPETVTLRQADRPPTSLLGQAPAHWWSVVTGWSLVSGCQWVISGVGGMLPTSLRLCATQQQQLLYDSLQSLGDATRLMYQAPASLSPGVDCTRCDLLLHHNNLDNSLLPTPPGNTTTSHVTNNSIILPNNSASVYGRWNNPPSSSRKHLAMKCYLDNSSVQTVLVP